MQVQIHNNNQFDDIFATVIDKLTASPTVVLDQGRIGKDQKQAVDVQADGNGYCLVDVTAARADDTTRTKTFSDQSRSSGDVIDVDTFGV